MTEKEMQDTMDGMSFEDGREFQRYQDALKAYFRLDTRSQLAFLSMVEDFTEAESSTRN